MMRIVVLVATLELLPERQDGFMRGVTAGQTVSVSCIGESVQVRFKD